METERKNGFTPQGAAGFSVIEMLVVISIISIVSSVAIVNYRNLGKSQALGRAAQELAFDIRRAQTLALGGVSSGGVNFGAGGICGYGISIFLPLSQNTYYVFKDITPTSGVQDCTNPSLGTRTSSSEDYEQITLEGGISISSLSSGNSLDIVFYPPKPTVSITGNASSAIITLRITGTAQTKTVTVSNSGQVSIQ